MPLCSLDAAENVFIFISLWTLAFPSQFDACKTTADGTFPGCLRHWHNIQAYSVEYRRIDARCSTPAHRDA